MNAIRTPLRELCLLMILVGLAALAAPFYFGPLQAAQMIGDSCTRLPSPGCTTGDTLGFYWTCGGIALVGGLLGIVALRVPGQPFVLEYDGSDA